MVFKISEFSAQVSKSGLAKNNLFVASVTPPQTMNLPIQSDLKFLCKSVSLPGMDINTNPIQTQGWGRADDYPTQFTKSNVSMTFMVDSNFAVTQYFHRWIQSIVNYNDSNGPSSVESNGKLPYQFDYRDKYIGTIDVIVFSEHGTERTYTYQFQGVFPTSIGSMEVAWENQAEIMLLTVSFSYTSFAVSGMQETTAVDRTNIGSGFSSGSDFSGLTGAISNVNQQFFGSPTNTGAGIQSSIDNFLSPINNIIDRGSNFVSSLTRNF